MERRPTPGLREQPSEEAQKPPRSGVPAFAQHFLSRKWLAILLCLSLFGHVLGLMAYSLRFRDADGGAADTEISLGTFQFAPEHTEGNPVLGAEFSVHVALLEDVDRQARHLLEQRRHRVQQGVEELLRKAHGGDFRDPTLADLKRRLQEQINEALGMRGIADVIVTDLKLQRPAGAPETPPEAPGSALADVKPKPSDP